MANNENHITEEQAVKKWKVRDKHGHVKKSGSLAVVGSVNVEVDSTGGDHPTADSTYQNGQLGITFHDIKGDRGNGITSIETEESPVDGGDNIVHIHCTDDEEVEGTQFRVKNGRRGKGVKSFRKIESSAADGGTNTWRVTFDDDEFFDISVLNGTKGTPGERLQPIEGDLVIASEFGNDNTKVLDQQFLTEQFNNISDSTIGSMSAVTRPALTNNLGYVKTDGKIGGAEIPATGFHSDAVSVQGGSLVILYTYASVAIAAISRYDSVGDTYTSLVKGAGSSTSPMQYYQFFATEDTQLVFSGFASKVSDSWVKVVTLGESVMKYIMDHASSKEDMQAALSKIAQIYESTTQTLALTKTEGSYVTSSGSIGSFHGGFMTSPVQIAAGARLKVNICAASSFAAIAKYDGEAYTPLVLGKGQTQGVVELEYTATEDMQIVLSGYTNKWSQTSATAIISQGGILKDIMDFIDLSNPNSGIKKAIDNIFSYEETKLELDNNAGYVTPTGALHEGGTVGFYTSPIQVHAGDTIEFYGSGTSNKFAVISKYNNGEYVPLVLGKTAALEMASYVIKIDEDMQVVFSGYANKLSASWARVTSSYGGKFAQFTEALVQEKIDEAVGNKGDFNPICVFNNIVAVGDSLTYCQVYTSSSTSRKAYRPWPVQVMKKCGLDEQLTFAAPGEDSIEIWRHYKSAGSGSYEGAPIRVPENGKTLAFIYLGTNGAVVDETLDTDAPAADVETYESSWANTYTGCYCKIIQRLLNAGAKVVLVQPRAGGTGSQPEKAPEGWTLEDTRRSIITIANRFGCAYIDAEKCHSYDNLYHLYPSGSGNNSLHFNDFGYTLFAEKLIEQVSQLPLNLMKRIMPD